MAPALRSPCRDIDSAMRPTRPDRATGRGVTLIELVVAIVLIGIIVATTAYFISPLTQSVDLTTRAELTDAADSALQRMGREVRLAVPNSVRVTTDGGNRRFLEFLPIRTAGRYRAETGSISGGADCPANGGVTPPAADLLSFDAAETCFKTIGSVVDIGTVTTNDFLVFNNYGCPTPATCFVGQNAYATAGTLNRVKITGVANEGTRARFSFAGTTLDRSLHDSPGKRFYVVIGNATTGLPEPVSYVCDTGAGTLVRRWGYTMSAAQPTAFPDGAVAQMAGSVATCEFDYLPDVAPQIGLLTLRLTLSRPVSTGAETVSLYHSIHVSN